VTAPGKTPEEIDENRWVGAGMEKRVAHRLVESSRAKEDEEMTPGLAEAARDSAYGTARPRCRRIEVEQSSGMRVLENEPPSPGVNIGHPPATAILLRPPCRFHADAL